MKTTAGRSTRGPAGERLPEIVAAQAVQTREGRNLRRRNALERALLPYLIRLAPILQWLFRGRRRMQRGFVPVDLKT